MAQILVVDDDASVAGALRRFFESEGHATRLASSVAEGLERAAEGRPDLVMMDIRMPGVDGLAGLDQMHTRFPGLRIVMMTAYGTSQTSIDAIRAGAFDYLTKPPDLDAVRRLLARALSSGVPVDEQAEPAPHSKPSLVGDTAAMVELYKMIGRLATNDVPALFVGELGTGKSLAIAQLHDSSPRRHEPHVRLDCTMPVSAIESSLFRDIGGTLHLANIDALPAHLQARLVRAIGDADRARTERIRARVLASTTADLVAAVSAGTFNRDLYDIVSLITIQMPALRDRRDDLPLLIRHFIQAINGKLNRSIRGVDDQALALLQDHSWPGNVRELERVLTRAAILVGGDVITANDLAFLTDTVFLPGTDGLSSLERSVRAALHERLVDSPSGNASVYHDVVDAVETALVKEALVITNGNQVKASELLGLNRATLRKKAPAE